MRHVYEKRFLGITTLSPFFQVEGVEATIENLIDRSGATAVACNTSVVAPGVEGDGTYQPPIDAGASVRLFDRPLWGKRALWLRNGPGHGANLKYFADSDYKPRSPNDLTESTGRIIEEFMVSAKKRGLKVYLQTSAATPPGLKDCDTPCLPAGGLVADRMANTGSLASEAIRAYNRAFTRDVFARYPMLDGIRPDWPEYPCYKLDEVFQDFSPATKTWAKANGYDFEAIRSSANDIYAYLHGSLKNTDLWDFADADRGKFFILDYLNRNPAVSEWFRLKSALSTDLLRDWREAVTAFGGSDKELSANAFMPPFSFITGLNFAQSARHCNSIAPKLYTMHWSLIIDFWGRALLEANANLDESLLVNALVNLLDLADGGDGRKLSIEDFGYPDPDEAHPIPDPPQIRKIRQAIHAAGRDTPIYPIVHGYGPFDDFCRRLQLVADSPAMGVWINRYGYLSDEKLDAIGRIWI